MMELRNVLCPLDFGETEGAGLDLAVSICRRFGARLVLEHNVDPRPPQSMAVTWMWSEEQEREGEDRETTAVRHLEQTLGALPSGVEAEAKLTRGPVDLALLEVARRVPADLLVMVSHGRSGPEHKSLTERMIVAAPCPVLTAPDGAGSARLFGSLEDGAEELTVVVPVEFEEHSLRALDFAFELLDRLPARLHVLHLEPEKRIEEEGARSTLSLAERVPEWLRERVEIHVEAGPPVDGILKRARELDASMIVMGTHPKGLVSRFLQGATSFEVLHGAAWPIWFVPASAQVAASGSRDESRLEV